MTQQPEIKQLIEKFESDGFQGGDFYHIQHLQIAWGYICQHSAPVAREKFHTGVLRLVTRLGAQDKYHRSLTDFFIDYLIQLRWYLGTDDWRMVEKHCPAIINDAKGLVACYFSQEFLQSEQAKTESLEGDILPLDRASFKLTVEDAPVFELSQHSSPLIVSMPHNGQLIPHATLKTMTPAALASADTDWYLTQIYDFIEELKITRISANYSRYLIDLNRNSSGEELYKGADNTELCPTSTFDYEALYSSKNLPNKSEIKARVLNYWQPYHQQLEQLITQAKAQFGYAILFEAHSIQSHVPRFFEGQLPDFNFGTFAGNSVNGKLTEFLEKFTVGDYSKVLNGRFKGGFITRQYAAPEDNIFTIQLELSQATHLDEAKRLIDKQKAQQVRKVLKSLLEELQTHSFI